MNKADELVKFIVDALQADNCEGGANVLGLTSVHHHDDAPTVTLETMSGLRFQFTVKRAQIPFAKARAK